MKTELLKSFVEAGKSTRQIAKLLDCSQTNVQYWTKKLGLQTRFKTEPKKTQRIRFCKFCTKQLLNGRQYRNVYCNSVCQNDYTFSQYIVRWQSGNETGLVGKKKQVSRHIRRWLFETRNGKCEECGWCKVNPHTGKVPLQIDHIDGNFLDNKPTNLKLLCPCCHSLTSTWGGANKHPGRRVLGCM